MKKIIMIILMMCFASVGYAEEVAAEASNAYIAIMDYILPIVIVAACTMVGFLVNKISQWLGFKICNEFNATIKNVVQDAIYGVEEYAANKLKDTNTTMTSNEKFEIAISEVIKKMPKLNREEIKGYINSALGISGDIGASSYEKEEEVK